MITTTSPWALGVLDPDATGYEREYTRRNRDHARLPLGARAIRYAVPRLNLPVMIATSVLCGRVFRSDGTYYRATDLVADIRGRYQDPRTRVEDAILRLRFHRELQRMHYRLHQDGFIRQGNIWYGPDCTVHDLGVLSQRVITNAGVGFIVDAFQNLVEMEAMNFHGMGTGAAAEAVGDSALGTEVETRATGTQSEPASNQIRSIGTITATAPRSVTEHGLFSASSAGVLWDRSVFTAVALATSDSIQFTYTGTFTAGGT